MQKLSTILQGIPTLAVYGNADISAEFLCFDSRRVQRGCVFFAVPGEKTDGHVYIPQAIASGAHAIVCEHLPENQHEGIVYVLVEDVHRTLGLMASAFYGHPSRHLKLVGVTGTNGKTTTATLLYRLFRQLGYKAGLLSTVVNYIEEKAVPTTHTTPDSLEINQLLSEMVEEGCGYCFMEVSSHAVVQERIAGLYFSGGLFSNLTHDHLDFHKTFESYLQAKKRFFDQLPSEAFALVNTDDRNGRVMVQNTKARVKTYALHSMADFRAKILENHLEGMLMEISGIQTWTRFIGEFNAYNLLCVYGAAVSLNQNPAAVLEILSTLTPVAGRFDYIRSKEGVLAIVDYAHTPDAVKNVLTAISQLSVQKSGKIIAVVGAGGDRDKTKRPVMAKIAFEQSDRLILTSDNPRTESPEAILQEMIAGIPPSDRSKVLVITDRREAIKTACALAVPGDIILLAGKGHENYQEINGVKYHFDDKEELEKLLIQ